MGKRGGEIWSWERPLPPAKYAPTPHGANTALRFIWCKPGTITAESVSLVWAIREAECGDWERPLPFASAPMTSAARGLSRKEVSFSVVFFFFPSLRVFVWFFVITSVHIRPGVYHQVVVVQPVQG